MKRNFLTALFPLVLVGWLTACGGGTPPGDTGTPAPTLAEQIKALEDIGELTKLDRSSDIRGPDANNNGIRDDIDAWISALSITDAQKKAAQQASRVVQLELLADTNDLAKLDQLGDASMAAVKCLGDSFKPNYQKGLDLSAQIEAMTANTRQRAKQYLAYNRAVSGSSGRLPEGNTCEP